jgi:hypothetical protein
MRKAGFIAASVGTAVVLAAGAAALTTALLSPNHGVEEAGAVEVAAPAPDADARDGNRGGLFSWFGGGTQQRESQPAAAEGERHVLPGVTEPARAAGPAPSRAASDDDDGDDD